MTGPKGFLKNSKSFNIKINANSVFKKNQYKGNANTGMNLIACLIYFVNASNLIDRLKLSLGDH